MKKFLRGVERLEFLLINYCTVESESIKHLAAFTTWPTKRVIKFLFEIAINSQCLLKG